MSCTKFGFGVMSLKDVYTFLLLFISLIIKSIGWLWWCCECAYWILSRHHLQDTCMHYILKNMVKLIFIIVIICVFFSSSLFYYLNNMTGRKLNRQFGHSLQSKYDICLCNGAPFFSFHLRSVLFEQSFTW